MIGTFIINKKNYIYIYIYKLLKNFMIVNRDIHKFPEHS